MRRFLTQQLLVWKRQQRRKPLVLRGVRQVGKTWSVIDFGKNCFEGTVHVVDLEKRPDWHRIFEGDLGARQVLSELEIVLNARIIPGRDLLFLDEIQSCRRAIMALRYFHEECPDLHVIAAGSLLEFEMRDASFPVGRVQFLDIHPMSFPEYLLAAGKDLAAEVVFSSPGKQPDSVHSMLLDELRRYLFIGGMPECVLAYVQSGAIREVFQIQADLVNAYRQDFSKYTPRVDKACLNTVLSAVAASVGGQVKYAHLAEGYANATNKRAFELLCLARLVHRVPAASPAGLPLGASASSKQFKSLMVDIGLLQHLCGMPVDIEYSRSDLLDIHEGAMAEQFVGQELIASGQDSLCYWARQAKNSNAEVDFLITQDGRIRPVEVKGGAAGRLRSLHLLLQTYPHVADGYVFSCAPYAELPDQRLVFLPLYYAYSAAKPAEPFSSI
jgi:uncharacterized protein